MKTINISLTPEQAKYVDKTAKTYGFANRSEFIRAILRKVISSPFTEEVIQKRVPSLNEIKKIITPILKKSDVEFAGIFGSYARGEAGSGSDLDLIVRFGKTAKMKSLLDIIHLENELRDALNLKVDLATEGDLHPLIEPQATKDLVSIYGKR